MSCGSDNHPVVLEWRETIEEVRRQSEERIRRLLESIIHSEKTIDELIESKHTQ